MVTSTEDIMETYIYTSKNGDSYELVNDLKTGDLRITKDKIGGRSYEEGSYDVIEDRTVMDYKARKQDVDVETQRPIDESASIPCSLSPNRSISALFNGSVRLVDPLFLTRAYK